MTLSARQLEDLRDRRKAIAAGGGGDKIAQRHAKGLMTARERLLALFQPDTYQEAGMHIRHRGYQLGEHKNDMPADGVITGTGYVHGQPVAAFSQDFTVAAGTLGRMHARKIVDLMKFAIKTGAPLVAFKDSGGARIQEAVDALSGYGEVFYHNVLMSGVVPQIAVICGPCAGGAAYSPALMDFIVMTRKHAHMFITGPEVIKAVTGRTATMEEVGGAEMHATVSGNVHFVVDDDRQAITLVQRLLSYLPPNNAEDPPHDLSVDIPIEHDEAMNDMVPADPSEPMDMRLVIARLVDRGELLEVHEGFARNIIVGFGRIAGVIVGLVANQPAVLAGALNIDASDKAAPVSYTHLDVYKRQVQAPASRSTPSTSSASRMLKLGLRPTRSPSVRSMRTPRLWKVLTARSLAALGPTRALARSRISAAALLVKVMAAICFGPRPDCSKRAILCTMTRVLPDPAPASTKQGPIRCCTACIWALLSDTGAGRA